MRPSTLYGILRRLLIAIVLVGIVLFCWCRFLLGQFEEDSPDENTVPSGEKSSQHSHHQLVDFEFDRKVILAGANRDSTLMRQSNEATTGTPNQQASNTTTAPQSSKPRTLNSSSIATVCLGAGAGPGAVFLVVTGLSREAAEQRAGVLATWGAELRRQSRLVFYLPVVSSDSLNLSGPSDLLTIKSPGGENLILAGLIWLRARCPKARAIILTSDRSFWNLDRLDAFFNSRQFDQTGKSIYGRWPKPETQPLLAAQAGFIFTGPAVDAFKRAGPHVYNDDELASEIPVTGLLTDFAGVRSVLLKDGLMQASSDRPIRVAVLACSFKNGRLMSVNGLGVNHMIRLWRKFKSPGLKCYRQRRRKPRRN